MPEPSEEGNSNRAATLMSGWRGRRITYRILTIPAPFASAVYKGGLALQRSYQPFSSRPTLLCSQHFASSSQPPSVPPRPSPATPSKAAQEAALSPLARGRKRCQDSSYCNFGRGKRGHSTFSKIRMSPFSVSNCYRPLFQVADNGSLTIDDRLGAPPIENDTEE
jgi:hypothetical protein